MQNPDHFFDLYASRSATLLSQSFPNTRLTIQDSDRVFTQSKNSGEIILSSTTLLLLVNVFFRMLSSPQILSDRGYPDNSDLKFKPYQGKFPRTLRELLSSSEGTPVQPDDDVRANLAKVLVDYSFDQLVLSLAAFSTLPTDADSETLVKLHTDNYASILLADQLAFALIFESPEFSKSDDLLSRKPISGTANWNFLQKIRLLYFAITTLFTVVNIEPQLPAAVRFVNLQQWAERTQSADYTQIILQACNEAILAIGEVTRRPPLFDGFNGVLNPGSKRILESVQSIRP